jgi:NitT/TauT family transport system permease protein
VHVSGVLPLLLPGPAEVLGAAIEDGPKLMREARATLYEVMASALLAVAAGFSTAIGLGSMPTARRIVFPYILATQVMPKVALAPILIAWLGTGAPSRLTLAFLIAYFPMVINTLAGLASPGEAALRYAQSLAASDSQILLKLRLPAALPFIMSGIKITVALSVVGIVVGELVASDAGLGLVIIESMASMDTSLAVAATFLIGLIGLVLVALLELIERRVVYWQTG